MVPVRKPNTEGDRAAVDRELHRFHAVTIGQIDEIAERHGVSPMLVRHRAAANYVRIGRKPVSKHQHAVRYALVSGALLAVVLVGVLVVLRLMD